MKTVKVRLTFLEPMLGTLPADEEIYRDYIATKNPDRTPDQVDAEVKALSEEVKEASDEVGRPITTFARITLPDGSRIPAIYGYVLKGMFKNACSALRECEGTLSSELTSYKKKIDQLVFVNMNNPSGDPKSPIVLSDPSVYHDGILPICERPLRAQTPQGERVAISSSEEIPAGSTVDFEVTALNDLMFALVFEWLDYGKLNGLGCWHNAGRGRFTYEVLEGDKRPEGILLGATKKRGRKKKEETEAE